MVGHDTHKELEKVDESKQKSLELKFMDFSEKVPSISRATFSKRACFAVYGVYILCTTMVRRLSRIFQNRRWIIQQPHDVYRKKHSGIEVGFLLR